ncbi:MAG: archaemetzincin family Zn-dependent metalloprotease [Bryobacteraceae bacterium]
MTLICVAPIGPLEPLVLDALAPVLEDCLNVQVRRMPALPLPALAHIPARDQYDSVVFLKALSAACPPGVDRFIGITSLDLCIPMLTFVFGQAQFEGRLALVSTARLDPRFYGMPADLPLLLNRAAKELLHEVGHTFGLVHCSDSTCVMSLSTGIQHVDLKRDAYCPDCAAQLGELQRTNENSLEHPDRR